MAGVLSRQITLPNHWSEAWADVERGLALIAAGKENQGAAHLAAVGARAGRIRSSHDLHCAFGIGTVVACCGANIRRPCNCLKRRLTRRPIIPITAYWKRPSATRPLTHLIANRKGFYAPLQGAMQWAKVKDLRQLRASLALSAAENYSVLEQVKEAAAMLDDARIVLSRRKAGMGRLGGRFSYLERGFMVPAEKQSRRTSRFHRGDELHAARIAPAVPDRAGRQSLYQRRRAPRTAMDYYNELLRDPLPSDWTMDPMETLAMLITPHPISLEHWFEVAWERQEYETAWEIADRARRHRFFSSLDMGGRLESLRWILEAPAELLDQQSLLQRQDLLTRWPQYAQLSEQARAIRAKLADMPLAAEDQTLRKEQSKALGELSSLSGQQEAILREIALRREPAAMIFPPQRSMSEIKKSLPKGHAILAFFAANRRLYGMLMSSSDYSNWEIGSPPAMTKQVKDFLHDMGQFQQNHELTLKELADTKWNQSAAKTLEALLKGSRADFSKSFEELIIVPDGILWYLPFEALASQRGRPIATA